MTHISLEFVDMEVEVDDKLYYVTFSASADMSYTPAQTSGPPEACDPGDSSFELTETVIQNVFDEDGEEVTFSPALREKLVKEIEAFDLEEPFWDEYHAQRDEGQCDRPDDDD